MGCVGLLINVESKTPVRHCGQTCFLVGSPEEAGGWQVTSELEMELPSLPQSQELGRSLQRDLVSRRKTNKNAKWNCLVPPNPLLSFPTALGGRGLG